MSLNDYPKGELEPRKLNKEEIEDPYQVIHGFFDYGHLPQIREHLWEWLKLAVSGNYHRESCTEKSNLLYFYEKIEQLVEAVHIIHQKNENKAV